MNHLNNFGLMMSLLVSFLDPGNGRLEHIILAEKLLRQHARDKMVGTPFHEFPEEPSRRTKRAVGADSCPAGYTGTFCESRGLCC